MNLYIDPNRNCDCDDPQPATKLHDEFLLPDWCDNCGGVHPE